MTKRTQDELVDLWASGAHSSGPPSKEARRDPVSSSQQQQVGLMTRIQEAVWDGEGIQEDGLVELLKEFSSAFATPGLGVGFSDQKTVEALTYALEVSTSVPTLAALLAAMDVLTRHEDGVGFALESASEKVTIRVLKAHLKEEAVQAAGLAALANLTNNNAEGLESLAEAGMVYGVLGALRQLANSATVQVKTGGADCNAPARSFLCRSARGRHPSPSHCYESSADSSNNPEDERWPSSLPRTPARATAQMPLG